MLLLNCSGPGLWSWINDVIFPLKVSQPYTWFTSWNLLSKGPPQFQVEASLSCMGPGKPYLPLSLMFIETGLCFFTEYGVGGGYCDSPYLRQWLSVSDDLRSWILCPCCQQTQTKNKEGWTKNETIIRANIIKQKCCVVKSQILN